MVINGTELIAVDCNEKFSGVCIYNFDYSIEDTYCRQKLDENCFASTIGFVDKCFCVQSGNQTDKSCDKLAVLKDPYQKRIVAKNLYRNQFCWIGRNSISDLSLTTHPDWSNRTNRNRNYSVIGNDGRIFEYGRELDCAICERTINENNRVRLQLKHNLTSNYIQLEIFNAIDAYQGVICFTGNVRNFINLTMSTAEYVVVHLWPYNQVKEDTWCKTLQLPHMDVVFSNHIKKNTHEGNIFSVTWTAPITNISYSDNISCPSVKSGIVKYIKLVSQLTIHELNKTEIVCHLHIIPTGYTTLDEYAILKEAVKNSSLVCENLGSVNMCFATESTSGSKTLHWPQANVGCTVVSQELCFQSDGLPVTRTCSGNGIAAAHWLPVVGSCAEVSIPPVTVLLNEILRAPPATASRDLSLLTDHEENLDAFQIHLISQILSNMATNNNVSIKDTMSTVSNMMKFPPSNLRSSQSLLNSTDIILWSLDEILLHVATKTDASGFMSEGDDMLLMQVTNLKKTDITGLKLLSSDSQGFNKTSLETLRHSPSGNEIEDNVDLALIIPQDLRTEIMECAGSKESPNVITSMFHNDLLFNEKGNATGKCDGKILSVLLPGFNCTFSAPLQVIFRANSTSNGEVKCVSWSYGVNEMMQSIHGHWSIEGSPKDLGNSSYKLCEFSHTTHFALLVLGDTQIGEGHTKALDVITAIGSGLSILGVLVILLTAVLFKSYRATNGVVINFSMSMGAQIIFLFIAGSAGHDLTLCTIFGALLHYAVLSQFFWMLTIALLQYQRYVIIFSSPPTHLVAKSCLFAWGVPLIPVITIISVSTANYGKNSSGLCYALGNYFIFGVIVPIVIITIVNLLIFLRIMVSIIASRRIKVHQDRAQACLLQLRLAFMLFFLLGLTWWFGFFATIGGGVVYAYLFCLTATLQGFVLFLFFIVLNEKTKSLWISITRCWRKSKDYDVTQDSASSVMMRRNQINSTDSCTDSTSDVLRRLKNRNTSEF
ncbi:adhesion G-protein coupled receptor G2-like [Photinus pyralis]|nr:adhesion G-protein coupled receptor G2-like [Photinus pyralis]